jgi:hypothetical protein
LRAGIIGAGPEALANYLEYQSVYASAAQLRP